MKSFFCAVEWFNGIELWMQIKDFWSKKVLLINFSLKSWLKQFLHIGMGFVASSQINQGFCLSWYECDKEMIKKIILGFWYWFLYKEMHD